MGFEYGPYRIRRKDRAVFGFLSPVFFLFSDDVTRSAAFDRAATEPESVVRLASAGWRASAVG